MARAPICAGLNTAKSGARYGKRSLLARRPTNVVLVAMANKTARVVWAMLSRGEALPDRGPIRRLTQLGRNTIARVMMM